MLADLTSQEAPQSTYELLKAHVKQRGCNMTQYAVTLNTGIQQIKTALRYYDLGRPVTRRFPVSHRLLRAILTEMQLPQRSPFAHNGIPEEPPLC